MPHLFICRCRRGGDRATKGPLRIQFRFVDFCGRESGKLSFEYSDIELGGVFRLCSIHYRVCDVSNCVEEQQYGERSMESFISFYFLDGGGVNYDNEIMSRGQLGIQLEGTLRGDG